QSTFLDREGRPHPLTEGQPLFKLLGVEPATTKRIAAGGDVARVPPFNRDLLLNTDFSAGVPLIAADAPSRPKGWRAGPAIVTKKSDNEFGVQLVASAAAKPESAQSSSNRSRVALGFNLADGTTKQFQFAQGLRAILAQE